MVEVKFMKQLSTGRQDALQLPSHVLDVLHFRIRVALPLLNRRGSVQQCSGLRSWPLLALIRSHKALHGLSAAEVKRLVHCKLLLST